MAKIGLNHFMYSVATVGSDGTITYSGANNPAKAISFNFEPTVSDAKLYADDGLAESDSSVTGGTITMGMDRDDITTMATILGHTVEDGEVVDNINDTAPYCGVGRIARLMVDGSQKFRATLLRLCKFTEPSESDNTRGESVEFGTYEVSGTMVVPQDGNWRYRKTFDTEEDAVEYLQGLLASTGSN